MPSIRRRRIDARRLRALEAWTDPDELREALAALEALGKVSMQPADEKEKESESKTSKASGISRGWDSLLQHVAKSHAWQIIEELGENTVLEPVYPKESVQQQFLDACKMKDHNLTISYHGTAARHIDSIAEKGLLLPGHGGVKVEHGSAHGVGIYTARLGKATLSKGFCDSDTMFLCAVCDTSSPMGSEAPAAIPFAVSSTHVQTNFPPVFSFQGRVYNNWYGFTKTYGRHVWTAESPEVRHVGDAVVVFEESNIVPVFTARAGRRKDSAEEATWEVGPQQIGTRRLIVPTEREGLIKFGKDCTARSGKELWVPIVADLQRKETRHERFVKNCRNRRDWKKARQKTYQMLIELKHSGDFEEKYATE